MTERFSLKEELALKKVISEIFIEKNNLFSEEEILKKKSIVLMDVANVCAIIPLTERAKLILQRFIDKEETIRESIKIKHKKVGTSSFSIEYVDKIIDILKVTDETISLTSSKNFPIEMNNTDFKIILAPRNTDYD